MSDLEHIAHIRIDERDFNVYISFFYSSLTLHAYKYNDEKIEFEWFDNVIDFKNWIDKPLR
jgi:hypothetical protein